MAQSQYLRPAATGALDLSCFNISCGAGLAICRDGEWFCDEKVPADKLVEVGDVCPLELDFKRHQYPIHCAEDVADKCGCLPCGGSAGGDTGSGDTGVTPEEVEAIAQTKAEECVADVKAQLEALKAAG